MTLKKSDQVDESLKQCPANNLHYPLHQMSDFANLILARFSICILLLACNPGAGNNRGDGKDTGVTVKSVTDLVPQERATVKAEPVATFSQKIENPLNDWKFQVQLFETPKTFRFLMKLEYEEMKEADTLKIPNLGFEPRLKIVKGEEPNSCIIGFLDKKDQFREYKKVIAKNNNLKVITLKHYAVYAK
jgi:hypothetical protein